MKRNIAKCVQFAAIIYVSICLIGFASVPDRNPALISNSEILWDGDPLGLTCKLTGRAKTIASRRRSIDLMDLVRMMSRKDQFAAAHVLLVELTDAKGEVSDRSWHGLTVVLHGDGSVEYNFGEAKQLQSQWEKQLLHSGKK